MTRPPRVTADRAASIVGVLVVAILVIALNWTTDLEWWARLAIATVGSVVASAITFKLVRRSHRRSAAVAPGSPPAPSPLDSPH